MRNALMPLLLVLAANTQSPPQGYGTELRVLPAGAGSVLLEPTGSVVYCTGTDLVRAVSGQATTLIHFSSFVFGSFTRSVGAAGILFGESSNGGLWLVPPTGSPRLL